MMHYSGVENHKLSEVTQPVKFSGVGDVRVKGKVTASITASGTGNIKLSGPIYDDVTLTISGTGDCSIDGDIIGSDVVIRKSGVGKLSINGSVHDTTEFTVSGVGSTHFSKRPSDKVIKNMNISGIASVKMPKVKSHAPSSMFVPQLTSPSKKVKKSKDSDTSDSSSSSSSSDSEEEIKGSNKGNTYSFGSAGVVMDQLSTINFPGKSYFSTGSGARTVISGTRINGGLSVIASGGQVTMTRNGVSKTYQGNNISIINGKTFIDGKLLEQEDGESQEPAPLAIEEYSD
jgi:hypothetical protein